jgi:hypothetical protein
VGEDVLKVAVRYNVREDETERRKVRVERKQEGDGGTVE